jgi:hypothetical protein
MSYCESKSVFCCPIPAPGQTPSSNHEALATAYKEVWFFFVLSHMTYLAAWSSILCLVVSGIIKHPEKMPMPVWISTIGLLSLYQTFIWAQANVIYIRFVELAKHLLPDKANTSDFLNGISSTATLVYRSLKFGRWETVVLVAMSISSDLILAALYSVKAIRSFFGIPASNRSEPWCLIVFLYFSSLITLSVAGFIHYVLTKVQKSRQHLWQRLSYSETLFMSVAAYLVWNIAWFFVWGTIVMMNLNDSQELGWKVTALGLPLISIAAKVYQNRKRPNPDPVVNECDSDNNECDPEDVGNVMMSYAADHRVAAIFHFSVAVSIIAVVLSCDIGMNDGFGTYSFHLNREQTDVDTERPTQMRYCAKRNSLPVQRWWCAVAWCMTSAAQHWDSYKKLVACSPDPNALFSSPCVRCAALIGGLSVAFSFHNRMEFLGAVATALSVTLLIWIFSFVTCVGPLVPSKYPAITTLRSVARAKWTEYAVSATLMHVVVNCIAGVINAHELVLLCGYMVVSMILVQLMELTMDRIESHFPEYKQDVRVLIAYEKPFIALSFFAKLALTVAIIVPVAFDAVSNRWEISMEHLWCPL